MLEKETIRDEINKRRMKICATYKRVKIIIVAESIIHF